MLQVAAGTDHCKAGHVCKQHRPTLGPPLVALMQHCAAADEDLDALESRNTFRVMSLNDFRRWHFLTVIAAHRVCHNPFPLHQLRSILAVAEKPSKPGNNQMREGEPAEKDTKPAENSAYLCAASRECSQDRVDHELYQDFLAALKRHHGHKDGQRGVYDRPRVPLDVVIRPVDEVENDHGEDESTCQSPAAANVNLCELLFFFAHLCLHGCLVEFRGSESCARSLSLLREGLQAPAQGFDGRAVALNARHEGISMLLVLLPLLLRHCATGICNSLWQMPDDETP
mmetsp:Transcript_52079/g.122267  ORF Transcript_52079/g.122267 Transcript_52079/m.122267 type:complete len:285 (+) Transcript_52079:1081-1935(+)